MTTESPALTARPARRARRVAQDEAHSWARNLRLKNPYGKLVLSMLTLYVNPDGRCFVGASTLAEDCELALETIRRRLVWLEQIGAITRFPQWLDENGRRNSDGRGRRTTDEIRLMIDADPEAIEAKAAGEEQTTDSGDGDVCPLPGGGQTDNEKSPEKSVAPPLGVCQPPHSGGGLTSEPEQEQEDSPLPPKGGDDLNPWSNFEVAWSEPILRQSIAQQVWSALTPAERTNAIPAARGYQHWRKSQAKPPNCINAHTFLREREAWPGFQKLAPPEPKATAPPCPEIRIAGDSPDYAAIRLLSAIARHELRPLDGLGMLTWRMEIPCGGAALAALEAIDKTAWVIIEKDSPKFTAWCQRIQEWLGFWPEAQRIWLDENDNVVVTAKEAANFGVVGKLPRAKDGLLVPPTVNGFPPAKGNSTDALMSEQDEKDFAEIG